MRKLLACAVLSFAVLAPASTLADPVDCVDAGVGGGNCADLLASEEMNCTFLELPGAGMSECMMAARAQYEACMNSLNCNY